MATSLADLQAFPSDPIGSTTNLEESKTSMVESNMSIPRKLNAFPVTGMHPLRLEHWKPWSVWLALALLPFVAAGVKSGASYLFGWIVFVGLISGWSALPTLRAPEWRLFFGFALFFCTVVIATIFGTDTVKDIRQLERYGAILLAFPAYLAIRKHLSEPGAPLVAGLFLSPLGALLFSIDWDLSRLKTAVTFNDPIAGYYNTIVFSNLTAVFLCLLITHIIIFQKNAKQLTIGGLLLFLGVVVLVGSASRMGILTFLFSIPLIFWLLRHFLARTHVILLFTGIGFLALLSLMNPPDLATERFNQVLAAGLSSDRSGADRSIISRFEMWQDSMKIWFDHPFTGIGPGSFASVVEEMRTRGATNFNYNINHAHSIYFHSLATLGTLGFLTMLWFLFMQPLRHGVQAWNSATTPWEAFYSAGLILTVGMFLAFGLTEFWIGRNVFFRTYLILFMVMVAGIAASKQKRAQSRVSQGCGRPDGKRSGEAQPACAKSNLIGTNPPQPGVRVPATARSARRQ